MRKIKIEKNSRISIQKCSKKFFCRDNIFRIFEIFRRPRNKIFVCQTVGKP